MNYRNFKNRLLWGGLLGIIAANSFGQIPHTNIFAPNDLWLCKPYLTPSTVGFEAAYEQTISGRAYQYAEDELGNSNCFRKRGDLLQLFGDWQDLLAALKGDAFATERTQLAQRYNLIDDDGTFGLFIPHGEIDIRQALFSARWRLNSSFSLMASIPLISYRLHNVWWSKAPGNHADSFDSQLTNDFVRDVAAVGNANFFDMTQSGFGDLPLQVRWARSFPQAREILKNVSLDARLGILLPTGKKEDPYALFAPGLGYGGGLGIPGSMELRLQFGRYFHAGVDVDLLYCFGDIQERKVRTDRAQTDLTLITRKSVYKDPGMRQKFTLFLEGAHMMRGLVWRVGYQYQKQNESRLYVNAFDTDAVIVNGSESLQLWTDHSALGMLAYDFVGCRTSMRIGVTAKWGFNGQRALAFDTITAHLGCDF